MIFSREIGIPQMSKLKKHRLLTVITTLGLIVAIGACSPRAHTRGNLPDPELVEQLKEGDISREEVAEFLGSPSSITAFGDEVWFYIAEQTETVAWLEPEIINRHVLALHFDKEGILTKIDKVGLEEAQKLVPVDRQTPTHGNKLSFLEQMVGNFRRFAKDN